MERREVLVLFNPEYDPNTHGVANGQIMADVAVAEGRMPREEAEAWMRDLQGLGTQGRSFFGGHRNLRFQWKGNLDAQRAAVEAGG